MDKMRELHLRGALGTVRTEMWEGREHLVVPVVALMEGVIHAVNAKTAEFVPASALSASVDKWNGHPLVVGHPMKDGKPIDAHDPTVLEQHGCGFIRATHVNGRNLGMEAMVDSARLVSLKQDALLADLRAGKGCEVSVGAYVSTLDQKGEFNGKAYDGTWNEIGPNHLALLPGGIGACSQKMGCGAHRQAEAYLVTAEGFSSLEQSIIDEETLKCLRDIPQAVRDEMPESDFAGPDQSFPIKNQADVDAAKRLIGKAANPDAVKKKIIAIAKKKGLTIPEAWNVKAASVLQSLKERAMALFDSVGDEPNLLDLEGMFKALAGARNSASDMKSIQGIHDHAASLGARCDAGNVKFLSALSSLEGESLDERLQAVNQAVQDSYGVTPSYAYARAVFDDHVIIRKDDKLWSVDYVVDDDGDIEFTSDPVEVVQKYEYVAAAAKRDCPACGGTGQMKADGKQSDCPTCNGSGNIKTASGNDAAILKAACGCEGANNMLSKEKRAELIAALVTDTHSGFSEGDEAFLQTASDDRLTQFRTAAEARKTEAEARVKADNDLRAAQAKLTVIEGKLKVAEQAPTEEQWLEKAPAGIKTLLENQKAQETEERETLIKALVKVGANTEDELKAMSTAQIRTLSKYAKVETVDYSGRGIAVSRTASDEGEKFAPPDPWADGLKALKAQESKAVN